MKKTGMVLILTMMAALYAPAERAVDFKAGSANVRARRADLATPGGNTWNFSETIPLIDSRAPNGRICGGLITTWTPEKTDVPLLEAGGPTHPFRVLVNSSGGATTIRGMTVWVKANFIGGADSKKAGFSAGDSISAEFDLISANSCDIRFAVKQGDVWYVTANAVAKSNGPFSLEPVTARWRTIAPDAEYALGGAAAAVTFDDVQAVGLYMNVRRDAANSRVVCKTFTADVSFTGE